MSRTRFVLGLMLALIALSAVSASGAFAAEEPQWRVATKVLTSPTETEEILAKQNGVQTLSSTGLTIECTGLKLKTGATIIGDTGLVNHPGTSKETIEYSGCSTPGFAKCKINGAVSGSGIIKTEPLSDKLAFETKAASEAGTQPTVTVFKTETKGVFAVFELKEATPGTKECPATGSIKVEGEEVVVKNLGTPETEALTHEIEAPKTAIKVYWTAKGVEHKVATLKLVGLSATYSGKAVTELALKKNFSIVA
jgi:hypothetical protein